MRESGNWTRNSGACGEKERELGDDNFLSRTEFFFQKSDFRASAGSNYLPEASFDGMEGGTSGGSREKGLIPERGSSKTTQNGTPSGNQIRRPVDESGESEKPKLKGVENFEVWKKGIKDIGKYRRWPASFTETYKANEIEKINTNCSGSPLGLGPISRFALLGFLTLSKDFRPALRPAIRSIQY